MGLLDGYPFDFYGNQPTPAGGLLGMLLRNTPDLPMPQAGGGFPAPNLPPTDVSAASVQPQQAPQQAPSQNPLSGLLSGLGSLFSPSQANAGPMQQAPQGASPGLLDRLTAGATNLSTGGNPLAGLFNAIGGLTTGQRLDPQGIMLQQMAATHQALRQAGVPDAVAQAAALNPEVLKTIAPQLYTKPSIEKLKDALGNEHIVFANPDKGTVIEPNGGGSSGGSQTGPGILAPGVKNYDPTLPADQYLAQFSPDMQAAMKAYMNGDVMPTGNPRQLGMANAAKGFAQLYGQKAGIPVSDTIYNAKRKMQTDLAASSNNSMGGILSNGKSAFDHLANLSDKAVNLGNYNGPDVPGGAHIAAVGNAVGNVIAPTSATKDKIQQFNDNALKYGQEATKFYAGSGGGEAERMNALKSLDARTTTAAEQAGFLETEKQLMLGRLREKENQIRDVLGDQYLQDHPVLTPELQKTLSHIDQNIAKLRGQGGTASAPGLPQGWSVKVH